MRTAISVVILLAAAWLCFFLGAGMNEPMGGATLFAVIAGFACVIQAVESGKKR